MTDTRDAVKIQAMDLVNAKLQELLESVDYATDRELVLALGDIQYQVKHLKEG